MLRHAYMLVVVVGVDAIGVVVGVDKFWRIGHLRCSTADGSLRQVVIFVPEPQPRSLSLGLGPLPGNWERQVLHKVIQEAFNTTR